MSRGNLLFDRADLTQKFGKLALYVDGTLPSTPAKFAYEGRLQIHNAIGDCWAELINGALPPGASVTVDNATHEVVVRWPAYSEAAVPVINGDFELDDTSWLRGYGWTIENKGARPGDTSGVKAAAFRGAGEAYIEAATFYPITGLQQSIHFAVQIQQGGSSAGNVRAAAALRYYDAGYKLQRTDTGNIVSSGSDGEWKGSGGVSSPAGAAFVRPAIWGLRKRQAEALYADDFTWDLSGVAVGSAVEGVTPITIRVHDSAGRVADWLGSIKITPPVSLISDLDFNNGFTDKTGKVWTVNNSTSGGKIYPQLVASPAKEGMSCLFSEFTKTAYASIVAALSASDALGTNVDFCAEMYVATAADQASWNTNNMSFFMLGGFGFWGAWTGVTESGIRIPILNWSRGAPSDVIIKPIDNRMRIGVENHFALTREGKILRAWWNGQIFAESQKGDTYNFASGTQFILGYDGVSSIASNAMYGSIDGFRFTRGWCRYSAPFAPPSLPYSP